jgi:hypothetical protein
MENDRVAIAALLFIILIVGINFVMYGIVRGMTRGGESKWMKAFRDSFSKPLESSTNKSMDELRRKMEELQGKNGEKQD